jgi:two-component system cell cycle sensor histidine kinase/response regulator CckA
VLILEDDPSNLQIFAALLWSSGYRVLEATSGKEAIEIAENKGNIDLLLSDVVVPERSGTEVALELTKSRPALTSLFISGTPMRSWDVRDLDNFRRPPPERVDFLEKPFRPRTLLAKIGELLGVRAAETALAMRP